MSETMTYHSQADVIAKANAYRMAVVLIKKAWAHIYDEPMQIGGESSEGQFQSCIIQLKKKVSTENENQKWVEYLDLPADTKLKSNIASAVINYVFQKSHVSSIDDITPTQFKDAILEVASNTAQEDQTVELSLPDFLRACLKEVFKTHQVEGKLNVGANRHFPRMFEWLQEVAEETTWSDGQGLKIRNAGGRGRVASNPSDPKTLKVVLDWNYLP